MKLDDKLLKHKLKIAEVEAKLDENTSAISELKLTRMIIEKNIVVLLDNPYLSKPKVMVRAAEYLLEYQQIEMIFVECHRQLERIWQYNVGNFSVQSSGYYPPWAKWRIHTPYYIDQNLGELFSFFSKNKVMYVINSQMNIPTSKHNESIKMLQKVATRTVLFVD